ncbi:SIMPL domain-containing protein [Streptomyces sp. NBC_01255]|uniref:SIMPL domain-containing protein n=1 Tax=Streptomyces sp. NBC_01255 TaxID=2903798 RepID=UPI002E35B165|nr:SIMPL domain-containing protein [Streptomyces sp. NBC_01255]
MTTRQPRTATTAHTAPTARIAVPPRTAATARASATARTARLLAATAVLGGLLAGTAAPALAAAPDRTALRTAARAAAPATVSVSGTGRAAAAPDLAILSVGVEATRKTAKEAMAAQSTAAKALLDVLHKQGIEDRDIRTDSLSLSPVYTQSPEGESKVTGYQAGQSFSVKVRDLDRTGQVIGAVNDATGDEGRINGVVFDVADPSALRVKAREAAFQDAYEKASQHARLSGHRLGRLVSLSEGDSMRPGHGAVPSMPADESGVPLAPGEIEEQVTVSAVFELL